MTAIIKAAAQMMFLWLRRAAAKSLSSDQGSRKQPHLGVTVAIRTGATIMSAAFWIRTLRLERDFVQHIAPGIGFNYYSTGLERQDPSLRGIYKMSCYGPQFYIRPQF
jgi:hypothetical protein